MASLMKTLYSHHLWVFGTPQLRNPTLTATDGTRTLMCGLSNLSGVRSQKKKTKLKFTSRH